MTAPADRRPMDGSLEAQIRALREELAALRAEQQETARIVEELNRTFRALATQLGVASEPYRKSSGGNRSRDLPGFA